MLKILVVNDSFPNMNNRTTILFKNIIPKLSEKFKIKVYWIITDEHDRKYNEENPNYEILFLSDYNNALEVLEKIKPDISYHVIGFNIMEYAFNLTEKFLKIPNFGYGDSDASDYFLMETSKSKIFLEYVKQFFDKKGIDGKNEKIRGINFLKKYLFLIKTFYAIGYSYKKIILEFLKLEIGVRRSVKFNEKFNCDLMFVENSRSLEFHVKSGLKRENLRVCGNASFYNAFKKREKSPKLISDKLNVLFLTANFSNQGKSDWSRSRRDEMLKELEKEFDGKNEKISLSIKIHPVSENIIQYKKLLKPNSNIQVIQKDDVFELISKSDIIITSCTSTAAIICLIMKKPIIIWNYFNIKNDLLLSEKMVLECKKSSELVNNLERAKIFRIKNEEKIEEKIKNEFVYGDPIQKYVNELEEWIQKIKVQKK